jgi:hypothetical protein
MLFKGDLENLIPEAFHRTVQPKVPRLPSAPVGGRILIDIPREGIFRCG